MPGTEIQKSKETLRNTKKPPKEPQETLRKPKRAKGNPRNLDDPECAEMTGIQRMVVPRDALGQAGHLKIYVVVCNT